MAKEVKRREFDYGIGTKLPFKVKMEEFNFKGELTPRYEWRDGKVRGGVVDSSGLYHWSDDLFDTVEEFEQYMAPYKIQEMT